MKRLISIMAAVLVAFSGIAASSQVRSASYAHSVLRSAQQGMLSSKSWTAFKKKYGEEAVARRLTHQKQLLLQAQNAKSSQAFRKQSQPFEKRCCPFGKQGRSADASSAQPGT